MLPLNTEIRRVLLYLRLSQSFLTLGAVAVLELGAAEDVLRNPETTSLSRDRRASFDTGLPSCLVPPQPPFGKWILHQRFCNSDKPCDIPQGLMIQVGSHLVYSCSADRKLDGNENVYCTADGVWSEIPKCVKIACKSLNSPSRMMIDEFANITIEGDVERWRPIIIACRPGYKKDTISFPYSQGEYTFCHFDESWDVEPMDCIPACGETEDSQISPTTSESRGHMSNLPWHASLYVSNGTHKNFICGATIIKPDVVLTAALCVYYVDKMWGPQSIAAHELFVMTGNTINDYDSPLHDPEVVKKAEVTWVRRNCKFKGLEGNYTSDIALLILKTPFTLSSNLLPACLDLDDDSEKLLQPGVYGRTAGAVRTIAGTFSDSMQTLTLPFISESRYNSELVNEFEDQVPISADKFTAGPTNGSGICGSGLVFKKNNRWQLMGILSTGYKNMSENGEKICNRASYSRYTRISAYLPWIFGHFNFGSRVAQSKEGCLLRQESVPKFFAVDQSYVAPKPKSFDCLVPPQPKNGEWRFHGHPCTDVKGCNIPQVTALKPGSQLLYSCATGYRASGPSTDVFCRSTGNWSLIPECIPVTCEPLNSASTSASCTHSSQRISCDSPVPAGTRAAISCRDGYKRDLVFVATRREIVTCSQLGSWSPDPIRCVPVCGVAINPQVPFVINGVVARVSEFPWHASIYMQRFSSTGTTMMNFQCGATIIQANLLLTAAHCVFDERIKKTVDPKKLFVMTGNTFRDWDSPIHDPRVVRKEEVKKVYKHSKYYGLTGNYVSDIALLELKKPFNFSGILLPACLDVDENRDRILEDGAIGRVAGFGRTAEGPSSGVLQTLTVPYVPYNQCKSSRNAVENEYLISNDKFCAGQNNGSAVCDGDSGGGLVFRKNELWYVVGIVSVGIGVDLNNGERTCDRYSYTLYTKVSTYMDWIQDVISFSEQYD